MLTLRYWMWRLSILFHKHHYIYLTHWDENDVVEAWNECDICFKRVDLYP